jgi:hypothetical protein
MLRAKSNASGGAMIPIDVWRDDVKAAGLSRRRD